MRQVCVLGLVWAARALKVSNKYVEKLGVEIGGLYPWLEANETVVDALVPWWATHDRSGNGTTVWSLEGQGKRWTAVGDRASFEVPAGRYELSATTEGDGRREVERRAIFAAYVRREVRELEPEDRDRFLDAVQVVYQTETRRGREAYGPDFNGLNALVTLHHASSSARDADHMHQGVGFLAQHAKLTEIFELAVRSVDPRAPAVPYWESSIEMAQVHTGALTSVFDAELWSPAWFGSIGAYLDDANSRGFETSSEFAIRDGRFAYSRSFKAEDAYPDASGLPRNAYGLLRAPWNNSPNPWVARYPSKAAWLPDCAIHRLFAESRVDIKGGDSWVRGPASRATWMYDVSNKAHGALHSALGGMVRIGRRNLAFDALSKAWNVSDVKQHTLWRFRVLDFPDTCTEPALFLDDDDGDGENSSSRRRGCGPRCAFEAWDSNLTAIGYEIVKAQAALPSPSTLASWRDRPSDLARLAEAYCAGPETWISGDAKDSGGTVEPSFWPIHPAMSRLYQYRVLLGPPFGGDDWPVDGACFGARSADVDPDRLAFGLDSTLDDLRPCDFADCCAGHLAGSRLFARYPDRPVGPTNADTLFRLDPTRRPLHLTVYHHFLFPHCDAIGIPFLSTNATIIRAAAAASSSS